MERENNIPIVIGVTGHRALRPEDRDALYAAVKNELLKIRRLCPNSPLLLLDSLAEGADLLCADAAQELGIDRIAVLPMEAEVYERDFSPEGLERFRAHCAAAKQVFISPFIEAAPENPGRSFLFRQAGIYVAEHSHIMLALWDGGEGKNGCGTADAVDFFLRSEYTPASGMPLLSEGKNAVLHIFTPRGERTGEPAGTVHILGDMEASKAELKKADEFNRLASALPPSRRHLLPEGSTSADPVLRRMEQVYLAASAVSTAAAKTFRRVLSALAVTSMIITLAFLLYDEAEAIWMICLCGMMLLGAWGISRFAGRCDCHRRYIEGRALAECLRVQAFLTYAGCTVPAYYLLSWTQLEETAWIKDALCALSVSPSSEPPHDILACWVEDQRNYHNTAQTRARRSSDGSGRIVGTALVLSVFLYLAALMFEVLCGGELGVRPVFHVGNVETYRTWLKIVLGSISAVTLFISNYYGKLSLSRQLSDHGKMERFYASVADQIRLRGQSDEVLTLLAREELIENANWCSYQRDNTPDFSL